MIADVQGVTLSHHAILRFQKRWRSELAFRDAARELYYAVARSKYIGPCPRGVLYETDDLERIPIVVREHKAFGKLVVSVLPAEARSCSEEELEEFAALGRLGTPEMPADNGRRGLASIRRRELTADEVMELARIERETAIAIEEVNKYEANDSVRVITELRARIAKLEAFEEKNRKIEFIGIDEINPNDPIMTSKVVAQIVQARKNDRARHKADMIASLAGKSEITGSLRIAMSALLDVIDGVKTYEAAEAAALSAIDGIHAINPTLITDAFVFAPCAHPSKEQESA